ncbi:hypothetical protein [Arthrobacter nitrophenolicus]|uniref:Uncharacterized protein n=1 Tax=Arthrobacter nitrophenolicus TaxID=683150 RepID=A0ACC6TG15_9MICC|nr:hypothetical protein [Arthrobacter nitrophenolicus]
MKKMVQQRCEHHLMYLEVFDENIGPSSFFQAIHLMKEEMGRSPLKVHPERRLP